MAWLGAGEIILILLLALVLFGPKKLPDLGKVIGSMLKEIRKASDFSLESLMEEPIGEEKEEQDSSGVKPIPETLTESPDVLQADYDDKRYLQENSIEKQENTASPMEQESTSQETTPQEPKTEITAQEPSPQETTTRESIGATEISPEGQNSDRIGG